ncbi:MAG: DUF1552 domain-containing protein, partial [Verrucomicrobia bacterium]|nr:DUF1552 domain-containing protein [Verrucomicrobiota bacterium]
GANFKLKAIMKPFEPFKDKLLTLKGVNNRVRGDGDSHMRGMSCLLTGIELFPGNIMGGGGAPAGWASGPSVDQVLRTYLQANPATKTRMGSLEIGVAVGNRADPWTRWSYAGANQPVAPISSPYELFDKLYGSMKEGENLGSVLDGLKDDIAKVANAVDRSDRGLLDQHATALRELERGLKESRSQAALEVPHPPEPGVPLDNDSIPQVTRLQTELLISAFRNDMARISTFQFTNSVGQARMKWIGIDESHHSLSHDPDLNTGSVEKLTKINIWFAEQIAFLAKRLQETPEPDGKGNMLDNTTIVWTNELGKGNSHTHEDIPWVLIGGGLGFKTGRALKFKKEPQSGFRSPFVSGVISGGCDVIASLSGLICHPPSAIFSVKGPPPVPIPIGAPLCPGFRWAVRCHGSHAIPLRHPAPLPRPDRLPAIPSPSRDRPGRVRRPAGAQDDDAAAPEG